MNTHITRRYFIKGLGLLSASAALSLAGAKDAFGQEDAPTTPSPLLAIIHTNDTHGHAVEVQGDENVAGNFSLAAVAQLKADWEAKGYEVILVDAGDATQGMPLVDQSSGQSAMAFMNSCGYALMAPGNHEFDHGPENIDKLRELADFPFLSANVIDKATGDLVFEPNMVVELTDGTKVGLFGLTTPATLTTANPKLTEGFIFLAGEDLYACAQEQVDELRAQGCDLVVCVGHLGNADTTAPSRSKDVLANTTGIDLFIDGHDHRLVEEDLGASLLVETGCYLSNIGLVLIDQGAPVNNLLPYGSYDGIDAATQAIIDDIDRQVSEELGVTLGHTDFFLDGNRNPGVRTQETNLGDLCCDAILWDARAGYDGVVDAALTNGGSIRVSIEAGDISLAIIKEVYPFVNQVMVVKVTGAQLLEALEASAQNIGCEGEIGAFSQVSGITYIIDASVPYEKGELYPESTYYGPANPGARVTIVDVGGRGFSLDETYTIATTDYIAAGGDTYYAIRQAADAEQPVTCDFDYEALAGYIIMPCNGEVPQEYEQPHGWITVVGLD